MRLIDKAFQVAQKEIGIKETGNNNPRILEYLKSVNLPKELQNQESTSWCSAFVSWCIQQAGGKSTCDPMAKSYKHWGRELKSPEYGCIVVLWRGSPDAETGHVGFFVGHSDNYGHNITILSGNQDNMVCFKDYPLSRVIAFRTSKD